MYMEEISFIMTTLLELEKLNFTLVEKIDSLKVTLCEDE